MLAELRHAGDRKGGDGGAVVAPFSRDDLVAALVAASDVVVAGELEADSTASEPDDTKKTSSRSPGATSAIIDAALLTGSCVKPQFG